MLDPNSLPQLRLICRGCLRSVVLAVSPWRSWLCACNLCTHMQRGGRQAHGSGMRMLMRTIAVCPADLHSLSARDAVCILRVPLPLLPALAAAQLLGLRQCNCRRVSQTQPQSAERGAEECADWCADAGADADAEPSADSACSRLHCSLSVCLSAAVAHASLIAVERT